MTPVMRLDGAGRRHATPAGAVTALSDFNLDVVEGRVVAIVGPSGSGKTTVLHLLVGWERPDTGALHTEQSPGDDWSAVAVVPQGLGLLPELTLAENIDLPVMLGNVRRRETAELALRLGVDHLLDRIPDEVSLGEQQRAAVARALISDSAVLVADEPTSHQDEDNTLLVVTLLAEAAADGAAVVVATHDPRVLSVADDVVHLRDGRRIPTPD